MRTIENIRTIKAGRFEVRVDAVEDCYVDTSYDDSGETARALEAGELVAFGVRAVCLLGGVELAKDYLGGCVYKAPRDFMDHFGARAASRRASEEAGRPVCVGSYFSGMVREVCAEARGRLRRLQGIKVRG